MSGFASSFWSNDYAGGLGVLFGKLQQGVQENKQFLTIARLRAEAEELFAQRLGDIEPATDRITGGFTADDGASARKAYEGVRSEISQESKNHLKIASNVRELVVNPFGRWCEAHEARVQNSQDELQSRVKVHDRQAESVRKMRSQYYNKCRLVEDLEEEDKLAFQDPKSESNQSPRSQSIPTVRLSEPDGNEDDDMIEMGDETYTTEQMKKILSDMLTTVAVGEVKVPILGTYLNVSSGADITDYIQKHLNANNLSYAERIGQDLVSNGYLRLVGNVGNTFANSSKMHYQWRPKVFQLTDIPEKKKPLERSGTGFSMDGVDSQFVNGVSEYLAGWNPLSQPHPNETPPDKLRREAKEADERYKAAVRKLDSLRCDLEESIIDHLRFMERCELDRLRALKAVILDFSGAISNVIPSLRSTVDNMMLFQETVQPLADLRYMLENYRTGPFIPKVVTYENYYNSVDEQTFGVDLEARARSDRKRVPIIITTLLTFLDNHYPDLEGDEARRRIWLVDVPLSATHKLRDALNTGKPIDFQILEQHEIPVVASVLKLYLLELPDSLVSSHVYEIIKTIYSTTATDSSEAARISVIQNTLGQLRLANIASLDAISTHFTRLIDLTSADEAYVAALAQNLAPCVLRPRVESSLTMNERYNYRLVRDLFAHKEAIFGELKRASSLSHNNSGRARAISTDESSRRAHMEERARAIAASGSRSRASSPAPLRAHRRDRSTGVAADTRFPVHASASPTETRRTSGSSNLMRASLEVPGVGDGSPTLETGKFANSKKGAQHVQSDSLESASTPTSVTSTAEKRDSGGKVAATAARFSRNAGNSGLVRQGLVGKRDSASSELVGEERRPHAVELTDKPMDD